MTGREAELVKSECESLRRISKDRIDVASSLNAEDAARSIRELCHPPSMKKTMRAVGIALAVAPEPITTLAGVALVAGSVIIRNEPATLKSVGEELNHQISELSDFGLADLTILLS